MTEKQRLEGEEQRLKEELEKAQEAAAIEGGASAGAAADFDE